MAKYTTELLSIVRMWSDPDLPIRDQIKQAAPLIFDFPYPIWEESHRLPLETKIIKHYIRWEIGVETVGMWQLNLDAKMNEIMPYYVQLYKTTLLEFDGYDIDITTILDRDVSSTLTEDATGRNKDNTKSIGKNFPQSTTSPADNAYYASTGGEAEGESEGHNHRDSDTSGKEASKQTRRGRLGARAQGDIIKSFRDQIIEIDDLIINDLVDQFFPLW